MKKLQKLEGYLTYVDLEGGYYALKTESGLFKLEGLPKNLEEPGKFIVIEGKTINDHVGIGFGTPTFKVEIIH